jgi:hypothetical protein
MTSGPHPTPTLLSHGGVLAAAGDELAPGSWLGRYRIVRLLGRGGMGCVYEAIHRDLGKRVAIKTLLPALAASPESRARFLREGQAAARICHPHVVDVTDVVADGRTTYLVMEYLEGEDLGARIGRQGALPLGETADILLPVVAAVAAAHDRGVIHRDLKPENVFLAHTAQHGTCPKVVDFGISKVLGDPGALALTATSTAFGTLYYLPPEQLRGAREADARSDQYALGAVLYECLTGCRAFDGDGIYGVLKNVAEGNYLPARARRPDLPAAVDAAIARALSVDPAGRFPSVRSLAAILLDFASPVLRAHWASMCGAGGEAKEPASDLASRRPAAPSTPVPDPRASSGTMILPEVDWPPDPIHAPRELAPPRAWAPRLILVGVAIGVAIVAVASAGGVHPGTPLTPGLSVAPPPPGEAGPSAQPATPAPVPRSPSPAPPPPPPPPPAPPLPPSVLEQPSSSPTVPRKHRAHRRPRAARALAPVTTGVPILD